MRHINETELHGVPHGDRDGPRTPPRWLDRKKFQMNYLILPNNFSFMKYAEKSVPGLADVGVPHGDGVQNSIQIVGGGLEKVSND